MIIDMEHANKFKQIFLLVLGIASIVIIWIFEDVSNVFQVVDISSIVSYAKW